jgi:hypothetical protein
MAEHEHDTREHRTTNGEPVRKPDEQLAKESGQTVVDPRPTAPEIKLGDAEYKFPPAAASPEYVLALEPNRYDDAVEGPDEQISMIDYTTWRRPNGGEFIAPVANDETYERKGFQRGENKVIPDLVAYLEDLGKTDKQRETEQRSREAYERHDRERREWNAQRSRERDERRKQDQQRYEHEAHEREQETKARAGR